ncbi:SDR family oxidoreductase [Pseudomonas putida]|uniref:SDR family oxidoreductase n=1 Tax=Pseudomonas putida TaxID=303 RepID=A0A7W2L4Z5_PSEPU|nr:MULTISPECIES: SDR family oxidoreductase [Pseudomonas]MBA6118564.1 SDR family oxidoreductase [Pseudomonas putida]MBI6942525.1 SDR family oxidoreductase [Pseudomonas putida]MBI6958576.1 SDR family oxidoreductase [Pseudomonas putida]MCZ9640790.1 SDR family oxidoreductase [Pseudomonas putida]MEC4877820.1 SDR family oxidoreductase [Pseudomonas sp. NC26]
MQLGISGKTALVCASSKGLGKACALALAGEGVDVVIVARGEQALMSTAEEIRSTTGVTVTPVCADIATERGIDAVMAACDAPDILVTNAGGPPTGSFREWRREQWMAALDANMLSPIELVRNIVDGMCERKFGRIINITSAALKAPVDVLGLSNGARAGLTGFMAGLARSVAQHNVTINNLLPGPFETERLQKTVAALAVQKNISLDSAMQLRRVANPSLRFGRPSEFGSLCAFLCSEQASYITGQNIVIDGGVYPGIF